MTEPVHVRVADSSQVGEARRLAVRMAQAAGFNEQRAGEVAIIASELANNLHRYGGGGEIMLQQLQTRHGPAIEVLAIDSGPGMNNVQQCLTDGYSTGGTPGNGLGAVRRLSSEFDIFSRPDNGSIVLSRVQASSNGSTGSKGMSWGVVSRNARGETVCGDTWRLAERDSGVALLIADGLGHGPDACEAAQAVAKAFSEDPFGGPSRILSEAHKRTGGTRGAAAAAVEIDLNGKTVRFCGVGNISASLLSGGGEGRGLVSHNGIVGHQATRFQEFEYSWPANGVLIMHSDGLQSRWDMQKYPGLISRHPSVISALLERDFTRGRDDVTVLAMRL